MSPWQPRFNDWAFNLDRGRKELAARWDAIPDDADIVVTHGPAYGFGDLTVDGLRWDASCCYSGSVRYGPAFTYAASCMKATAYTKPISERQSLRERLQ